MIRHFVGISCVNDFVPRHRWRTENLQILQNDALNLAKFRLFSPVPWANICINCEDFLLWHRAIADPYRNQETTP